jgi:hypothetical protein
VEGEWSHYTISSLLRNSCLYQIMSWCEVPPRAPSQQPSSACSCSTCMAWFSYAACGFSVGVELRARGWLVSVAPHFRQNLLVTRLSAQHCGQIHSNFVPQPHKTPHRASSHMDTAGTAFPHLPAHGEVLREARVRILKDTLACTGSAESIRKVLPARNCTANLANDKAHA